MTGNPLLDSDEYARLLSPQEPPARSTTRSRGNQEACPACDCPFYEKLYRVYDTVYHSAPEGEFWLVQCDNCRLVRLFPWPEPPVAAPIEKDPFGGSRQGWDWVYSSHLRFIDDTIAHVQAPGILLSAAQCHERLLTLLQQRRLPVVAMDSAFHTAAVVWHSGRVPSCVGDMRQPPFRQGSCGIVLLLHVLEYLTDPVAYLEHVNLLLHPAGRLVVQTPNLASWQFLWRGPKWHSLDVPRRLYHFRASDLRVLLESCGFEVIRKSHFTWRDSPRALASSLVPRLDPTFRRRLEPHEQPIRRIFNNVLYALLTIAAVPFTLLEALACSGATVMVEARKVVPDTKEKNAPQT